MLHAKALRTFPFPPRRQYKGAAERSSAALGFTQRSHHPPPAPTSAVGRGCHQGTCALRLFPQLSSFGTLPDHVGSNMLKAALPYAKYNANPSPSLCLQSRNSAQQNCLPQAHGFCAQVPPLLSRGSCHSLRVDFLPLIPCLVNFCPFRTFASIGPPVALTCAHAQLPPPGPELPAAETRLLAALAAALLSKTLSFSLCRLRSHAS